MNQIKLLSIAAVFMAASGCVLGDESVGDFDEFQVNGNASQLWGENGERWSPTSRLADYSFAGYRAGARGIPTPGARASVKDFGAKGNGTADDTAAFRQALQQTTNGAVFVPAGRYKISGQLAITKSNVVLRGAGENKTTLFFSQPVPEENGGIPYNGGMIFVEGKINGTKVTNVSANAKRGDRTLTVASASGIKAGDRVRLRMKNPADNSLGCHLYADRGCLNKERQGWYGGNIVDWVVHVTKVSGTTITLERSLRIDVKSQWKPEIWRHQPTVSEVGIEDLTIEFPRKAYAGHHKEAGYFGIYFEETFNSWVRNITIVDGDRNVSLSGAAFTTVSDVTITTSARNGTPVGHYGFSVGGPRAQDNLITRAVLTGDYVHNLAVMSFANGNVYSDIVAQSPIFDHHGAAPYENLYTSIVLEKTGQQFFKSGGNRGDEPNGTRTTVWNVEKEGGSFGGFKTPDKFPQANIVGVQSRSTTRPSHTSTNWWFEKWRGKDTHPQNLHAAQFKRRTGKNFPQ